MHELCISPPDGAVGLQAPNPEDPLNRGPESTQCVEYL